MAGRFNLALRDGRLSAPVAGGVKSNIRKRNLCCVISHVGGRLKPSHAGPTSSVANERRFMPLDTTAGESLIFVDKRNYIFQITKRSGSKSDSTSH